MENAGRKKFDYNIVIIVLCFMSILLGIGMWGSKSYFIVPITEALGISRTAYSFVDTIRYIVSASVSMGFGFLVKKFATKPLLIFGFVSMAASAL
jgi:hypothetical protein